MRVTLAACALMLALAAPAQGADKQSWGLVTSGDEVLLVYGVPESDIITVSFICEPKANKLEIVTTVVPARPRKGQSVRTTLSNGVVTAAYDGKLGHHEEHGYHFAAPTAADPKVADILRSGAALTISIPGKRERVPLRGIAAPLAKFQTACFRKR
jgi:hypothetical protein